VDGKSRLEHYTKLFIQLKKYMILLIQLKIHWRITKQLDLQKNDIASDCKAGYEYYNKNPCG